MACMYLQGELTFKPDFSIGIQANSVESKDGICNVVREPFSAPCF